MVEELVVVAGVLDDELSGSRPVPVDVGGEESVLPQGVRGWKRFQCSSGRLSSQSAAAVSGWLSSTCVSHSSAVLGPVPEA